MIITHLESRPGEVLVRLPDGTRKWVAVGELIALAESDKPEREEPVKPTTDAVKKKVK